MALSLLYPFQSAWYSYPVTVQAGGLASVFSTASAVNPIGSYILVVTEQPNDQIVNQGVGSQVQIMFHLNDSVSSGIYDIGWTVGTTYATTGAVPTGFCGVVVGTNSISISNNTTSSVATFQVVIYKIL